MSRMYKFTSQVVAWPGDTGDIFEISVPTDTVIKIHSLHMTLSDNLTDFASRIQLNVSPNGLTGTTKAAEPVDPGDPVSLCTCKYDPTVNHVSTDRTLGVYGFLFQAGFRRVYAPEERPIIVGGEFFSFEKSDGANGPDCDQNIECLYEEF